MKVFVVMLIGFQQSSGYFTALNMIEVNS
jgi:hypothetical protein